MELPGYLNFRRYAVGDDGEVWEIPIMIQEKVQFDGSFSAAKASPVEHLETQIDNGGIHADQFVLEPKLPFPDVDLTSASIIESQKDKLVKFPRTMLIGISQSGMAGRSDTQMLEFTFAASQTSRNLSERIGPSQLAEQHGYKLAPGTESPGVTLGFRLVHHLLELQPRKQLQNLTEHATILTQVSPPLV